jgi:hypothetical protein
VTSRDAPELARWTLPQALVWIIFRTPQAVAITPNTKDIFDVTNDMVRSEGIDEGAISTAVQRREELLDYLKRGKLQAWGIPRGQTEHSPVPSTSWDTIDSFFIYNGLAPSDVGSSEEESARYREVYLIPDDVEACWASKDKPYRPPRKKIKREAIDAAIKHFGLDALLELPQKGREQKIIDLVKSQYHV